MAVRFLLAERSRSIGTAFLRVNGSNCPLELNGGRIDPANVAVRPAVYQIDAAVPGVAEHYNWAPVISSSMTASLTGIA